MSETHLEEIKRSVQNLSRHHGGLNRVRSARETSSGYHPSFWQEMSDLGLIGVMVAESRGGLALGLQEATLIARELGRVTAPEPYVAAQYALMVLAGADEIHLAEELSRKMSAGGQLVVVADQESHAVFEQSPLCTVIEMRNGQHYLRGEKRCISGGALADGYLVTVSVPEGIEIYYVSATAPGVVAETVPLADGTVYTNCRFDTPVDDSQRIASANVAQTVVGRARSISVLLAAAELVGVAEGALEITLEYLRTRKQFDQYIGSFQALQHRAVDCSAKIELSIAVLEEAATQSIEADTQQLASQAARAKARAAETAMHVVREAVQMHGAMGFTEECDVSLFVKRALVMSVYLGGASSHRKLFAELNPPVSEIVVESPPLPAHLQSPMNREALQELSDDDFRMYLRSFIEAHYPEALRYLPRRVRWAEVADFNLALAKNGLVAPAWPADWGGMGLSPAKQLIYFEENERWGVGRPPDQGIRQLGPVLIKYGTEAQQQAYLPKILSFEHIWCQGYSEPNSGSDLASVRTSGVVRDDRIVINGQKIWTSLAGDATHIYVLCRTDPKLPKREGLSFVILPMDSPGITLRDITNIAGENEFCEVFFDDVEAPLENIVGGLNQGWTVAKALLGYERLGVGAPHRPLIALNRLTQIAEQLNLFDDPEFLGQYTVNRLDLVDHATLYAKITTQIGRGEAMGPEVSFLKVWGMEALQRTTEFALERAESLGALAGAIELNGQLIDLMSIFYMGKVATIGGGTNEIQRNLLARQYLDLPR
ncbi:MAG: acyl-CoA dehydrogenase family protein [Pseudomonadota bacterium]